MFIFYAICVQVLIRSLHEYYEEYAGCWAQIMSTLTRELE